MEVEDSRSSIDDEVCMLESLSCAVVACTNNLSSENEREGVTYHRFPSDPVLRAAWVTACMRPPQWPSAEFAYVCSDHFEAEAFEHEGDSSLSTVVALKPDAIPNPRLNTAIKTEPADAEEELQQLMVVGNLEVLIEQETNAEDLYKQMDAGGSDYPLDGSGESCQNVCKNCQRKFKTDVRLRRHEIFCVQPRPTYKPGPRANSGTACFYKDCNIKFYHRNKMLKHMEIAHNCTVGDQQKLEFDDMEAFWTWKENEEERTYSYFSKKTGNHKNTSTYNCQRDGPSRARLNAEENSKAAKRQMTKGNIKENIVCLAHIKTTLNGDGTVSAMYFSSHNHPLSAMDYLHHPLSRSTQMFIKEKLELGYSPRQIADELLVRQNASSGENSRNMTKNQFLHMVNKLDRIRGFFDREKRRVKDDMLRQPSCDQPHRRSRKVVFEEQFEMSRRYQEKASSSDQGENSATEDSAHDVAEMYLVMEDEDKEYIKHIQQSKTRVKHEPSRPSSTTQNDSAHASKRVRESDYKVASTEPASSQTTMPDILTLYNEVVLHNNRLRKKVVSLRKRLAKKERQTHLLIDTLKKSFKEPSTDLDTLKETVSDGDYEILLI